MTEQQATWQAETQRLDRVLQATELVRSRSVAQKVIAAGQVQVNGVVAKKSGVMIHRGQRVSVSGVDHYVSRGAHKLLVALDRFGVNPEGRVALDVGASTGGFTQVLLERGAEAVLAIDVGHDQLAQSLRDDTRVKLYEGCNARYLTAAELAAHTGEERPPSLIVGDLSFISLTQVLPALAALDGSNAEMLLLIKPQFEVGREGIGAGVVTDPGLQRQALQRVLTCAAEHGLTARGLVESPIVGTYGNREFLVHLAPGAPATIEAINEMIAVVIGDEGSARE